MLDACIIDLDRYRHIQLPTLYQQQTHLTKYSRYRDELGRREFWPETVYRYCHFMFNHIYRNFGYLIPASIQIELYEGILFLMVMPSMRAMMTAGPALERDNMAAYNPVVGETRVLTREYGLIEIEKLEGQAATVLNIDGRWAHAVFRCYGEQPIREVECRLNSNTVRTVRCSPDHRWPLLNREILATDALRPGDRLPFAAAQRPEIDADYRLGVIHGLVYGDGTTTYKQERVSGYMIRICEDVEDILPWFEGYPVAYPKSADGDPVVMLYDGFAKTHGLKDLPSESESESYLLGFFRGWFAADGYVSKASQINLCVAGEDRLWLERVMARIGVIVQRSVQLSSATNYGKRKKESWQVFFSRSSMVKEDFLIRRKAERFQPLESHFVVSGVRDTRTVKKVYCAEVPDTNTFVLECGLVTGNCAYAPCDRIQTHDEAFLLTMCSVGVGFSVERQYTNQMPNLPDELNDVDFVLDVEDDKISWASNFRELFNHLYVGRVPKWNTSKVRKKGERLITFGGRASGPEPLEDLFQHTINIFKAAVELDLKRLTSYDNHDLMTKASDVANSGGVRRGAEISLSNPSDERMRDAKSGEWWNRKPHFRLANNSAVWTDMPSATQFADEWLALIRSQAGERGQISRRALIDQARRARRIDVDKWGEHYGLNPCGEIILRPRQFCNLTTNIIRADDGMRELLQKIRLSTILGTLQSTLTNFRYLQDDWRKNCEEERLLGVSLNGIFDNHFMSGLEYIRHGSYQTDAFVVDGVKQELPEVLGAMRDLAVETNRDWADRIGINPSAAITTVKPEGNNSNLVDCASGLHGRHAKHFYIRTNRANKVDPVGAFMMTKGVYTEQDVMSDSSYVMYFPITVPEGAITREDYTAMEHLQIWLLYQQHYCEHKPSVTISVKDREWMEVGGWVHKNFDWVSGIAFLPFDGGNYRQAPYITCTKVQFDELKAKTPETIDWTEFKEDSDYTEQAKEFACMGGMCEI